MNANLLRGAMAEADVTQSQLAKKIGIAVSTLSAKINGHTCFDTDEIVAICDALHITDLSRRAEIFLS